MRALVTGATGFLGVNLVYELKKLGWDVVCLVRDERKAKILPEGVEIVKGDIEKRESMKPIRGIDVVFHIAGLISSGNPRRFYEVNYKGTQNLISVLSQSRLKRFVFVSSIAAGGPKKKIGEVIKEDDIPSPVDEYGKSKLLAEKYLLSLRRFIPLHIIRPTAIYGHYDYNFLPLFRLAVNYFFPVITRNIFSLVYVEDVVSAMINSVYSDAESGTIFNISDGEIYDYNFLYETLSRIYISNFGKPVRKVVIPFWVVDIIREVLKNIRRTIKVFPFDVDVIIRNTQRNWVCSIEKAKKLLNYSPKMTLEEGLKKTIMWYKMKGFLI